MTPPYSIKEIKTESDRQMLIEFYTGCVKACRDELNQARIRQERAQQHATSAMLESQRCQRLLYELEEVRDVR